MIYTKMGNQLNRIIDILAATCGKGSSSLKLYHNDIVSESMFLKVMGVINSNYANTVKGANF